MIIFPALLKVGETAHVQKNLAALRSGLFVCALLSMHAQTLEIWQETRKNREQWQKQTNEPEHNSNMAVVGLGLNRKHFCSSSRGLCPRLWSK